MLLERYAWDVKLFWGIDIELLTSNAWRDILAVADANLGPCKTVDSKRILDVTYVYKRLKITPNAPGIEEGLEVELLRYMSHDKRAYVANL